MNKIYSSRELTVSYEVEGSGPPLVLVHGGFSDHRTNWEFVLPALTERFTVYSVARRGRGETTATRGHSVEDEGMDVVEVLNTLSEPAYLLGHSYGAHTALFAAGLVPDLVRKLVLYEAPVPALFHGEMLATLQQEAAKGNWDALCIRFFHEVLRVPLDELTALQQTPVWPPILEDAPRSLEDLRALKEYVFEPGRYRMLRMPVLLQTGSESPRELYVTDLLAGVLPNATIQVLPGQAHEGMTTAPSLYAEATADFLLSEDLAMMATTSQSQNSAG